MLARFVVHLAHEGKLSFRFRHIRTPLAPFNSRIFTVLSYKEDFFAQCLAARELSDRAFSRLLGVICSARDPRDLHLDTLVRCGGCQRLRREAGEPAVALRIDLAKVLCNRDSSEPYYRSGDLGLATFLFGRFLSFSLDLFLGRCLTPLAHLLALPDVLTLIFLLFCPF